MKFIFMIFIAGILCPVFVQAALIDGLVSYWQFDSEWTQSSNRYTPDSSGNGNTGQVMGANLVTDGKFGYAYNFDGVNDYIDIASLSVNGFRGGFTFSAWFCADTISTAIQAIAIKHHPLLLHIDQGGVTAGVFTNQWYFFKAAATLSANQWYQTTVVWNDSNNSLMLYVNNGQSAGSAGLGEITSTANYTLSLGNDWGNGGYSRWYFDGKLDEIALWNRPLSTSEVTYLQSNAIVPSSVPELSSIFFMVLALLFCRLGRILRNFHD